MPRKALAIGVRSPSGAWTLRTSVCFTVVLLGINLPPVQGESWLETARQVLQSPLERNIRCYGGERESCIMSPAQNVLNVLRRKRHAPKYFLRIRPFDTAFCG